MHKEKIIIHIHISMYSIIKSKSCNEIDASTTAAVARQVNGTAFVNEVSSCTMTVSTVASTCPVSHIVTCVSVIVSKFDDVRMIGMGHDGTGSEISLPRIKSMTNRRYLLGRYQQAKLRTTIRTKPFSFPQKAWHEPAPCSVWYSWSFQCA